MNTNPTLKVILNRRSIRAYEARAIDDEAKAQILHAAMRAPTAGNMMLYSIIEVTDQGAKDTLAETCDHQPFIARAPLVLLFVADYQRWHDYFVASGVKEVCQQRGQPMQKPEEADLFLACCDALIAAQTAVITAESLGIGSCYIGDIMENAEAHRELFALPQYAFPICLLCFGHPTEQQRSRPLLDRFAKEYVVFQDRYRRLKPDDFAQMFAHMQEKDEGRAAPNIGQRMYDLKFSSDFAQEMRRSVRVWLDRWVER